MNNTLKIYYAESTVAPYDEYAGGNILSTFNAAVLDQLLKTDSAFNLEPGLISEFKFDFKTKAYILTLRENLKFHNGRTATATDLEFSLVRGFFSPTKSFYHTYLGNVEGIDAIPTGGKFTSGAVSGIKIINDRTISVKLSQKNSAFLHSLTNPYFSLVPREEMNSNYLGWKTYPIGAGPYRVIAPGFKDQVLNLEAVSKSEQGPAKVMIIQGFDATTKYDIALTRVEGNLVSRASKLPQGVRILQINKENELGKNPNFRKGLKYAIDRKALEVLGEHVSAIDQVLPKHFWDQAAVEPVYDLNTAKKYFSMIPTALKEKTWEIQLFSTGDKLSDAAQEAAKIIEPQLLRAGLRFRFVPTTEKFPTVESTKNSPLRYNGKVSDYVDPLIMFAWMRKGGFQEMYHPPSELHDRYQELYNKAANANSLEQRVHSIKNLSTFVRDEALIIALSEEKNLYYINPDRIETLGNQPQPLTLFIKNIKLKDEQ